MKKRRTQSNNIRNKQGRLEEIGIMERSDKCVGLIVVITYSFMVSEGKSIVSYTCDKYGKTASVLLRLQ